MASDFPILVGPGTRLVFLLLTVVSVVWTNSRHNRERDVSCGVLKCTLKKCLGKRIEQLASKIICYTPGELLSQDHVSVRASVFLHQTKKEQ